MSDDTTKRTALAIALISSFITPFMGSGVHVALPTMGREFKIAFLIFTVLCFGGIFASMVRGKLRTGRTGAPVMED